MFEITKIIPGTHTKIIPDIYDKETNYQSYNPEKPTRNNNNL